MRAKRSGLEFLCDLYVCKYSTGRGLMKSAMRFHMVLCVWHEGIMGSVELAICIRELAGECESYEWRIVLVYWAFQ